MKLFRGNYFNEFSDSRIQGVVNMIMAIDNQEFLNTDQSELEAYYTQKTELSPPAIRTTEAAITNRNAIKYDVSGDYGRGLRPGERFKVSGTALCIDIPFAGDSSLLELRPSSYRAMAFPPAQSLPNAIRIKHKYPDDSADAKSINGEISRNLEAIQEAVDTLASDCKKHNAKARNRVAQAIEGKRSEAQKSLDVLSGLDLPLSLGPESASISMPIQQVVIPTLPKPIPGEQFKPQPRITNSIYDSIIKILLNCALVFERSPSSFATLQEEDIRDHFLLQLNGHFRGDASGEIFNATGKTDILIKQEGRTVFIAECKFWKGQSSFNGAIDQLLRYLSWRDTKCAVMIFNRNKNSSDVRDKMATAIKERDEYVNTLTEAEDFCTYIFSKETDEKQMITITTMIFDFPTSS